MDVVQMSPILLVLTSAGVAAFVSGLITLSGQYLERRSRRRELLLAKSLEFAIERTRFVKELADKSGATVEYHDPAMLAEVYYQWFLHLIENDALPADAPTVPTSSRAKLPESPRSA